MTTWELSKNPFQLVMYIHLEKVLGALLEVLAKLRSKNRFPLEMLAKILGGFAGFLKDNTPSGQTYIEDCYSITIATDGNAITTDGHDLKNGGFIGALEGGKVKNSYSYSYF